MREQPLGEPRDDTCGPIWEMTAERTPRSPESIAIVKVVAPKQVGDDLDVCGLRHLAHPGDRGG